MDALGPAEDAEHDLPLRVLLVKLPAWRAETGIGITAVVTMKLVVEGVSGLPVSVSVRHENSELWRRVRIVKTTEQTLTHLQHFLCEILLVVTQRAFEEVSPGILGRLLDTVSVEPTTAARRP